MKIFGNWLQNYLSNRESLQTQIDPYAWLTESSTFENKPSYVPGSNMQNTRSANMYVISKKDVLSSLDRADCEEYLKLLIDGFIKRQHMFDQGIDVDCVVDKWRNCGSWKQAFLETLSPSSIQMPVTEPVCDESVTGYTAPIETCEHTQHLNEAPTIIVLQSGDDRLKRDNKSRLVKKKSLKK